MVEDRNKKRVFLAAPNAPKFATIVDDIVIPVIAARDLTATRIPTLAAGPFAPPIVAQIRPCALMIAVATGRNPNVFWEIGAAYALGLPIILVCREEMDLGIMAGSARVVIAGQSTTQTQEALGRELDDALHDRAGKA